METAVFLKLLGLISVAVIDKKACTFSVNESQLAVYTDWLDGVAERTGNLPFPISYSSHDHVMCSSSLPASTFFDTVALCLSL